MKCQKYWPDESSTFGRITVRLEEKEELADFEISTFTLQMVNYIKALSSRLVVINYIIKSFKTKCLICMNKLSNSCKWNTGETRVVCAVNAQTVFV